MTLEEELTKILIEGASEAELAKCKLAELKPINPDSKYNQKQLKMGIEVEKEHTHNPNLAKMITKHHLDETDPEKSTYYDRLAALEKAEEADHGENENKPEDRPT